MKKFVVLTYHRVTEEPDALRPVQCHAAVFRRQLRILARYFNVLPLAEAVAGLTAGTLPSRTVCISFDDGYRDNYEVALPLLAEAGLPATFFVASGYLDGGMMWNDCVIEAVRARDAGNWDLSACGLGETQVNGVDGRRDLVRRLIRALKYRPQSERDILSRGLLDEAADSPPDDLMMSSEQVRQLAAAGMALGGHTVSHPILAEIDDATALDEMRRGRAALEQIAGMPVTLFAYPNGKPGRDYGAQHPQLIEDAGFAAAFTTAWGYASARSSPWELPRIGFETETGWSFGARLARAFWQAPQA